jgi:sigma-E factor negative regulatory protein RseA
MTHEQRQRLSALADDAAGPGQATAMLAEVEQSPALRACWQRYHVIGSVLRGEPINRDYCAIADRVRAAVEQERRPDAQGLVSRLRRWLARMDRRPGLLLPAYGGTAAVALALGIVTFGLIPQTDSDRPGAVDIAAVDAPSPAAGTSGAGVMTSPDAASQSRWQATSPALSSKLDRMFVGHRESASALTIKGFIPYAAVVGNGVR